MGARMGLWRRVTVTRIVLGWMRGCLKGSKTADGREARDAAAVPGHCCRLWERVMLLQGFQNTRDSPHKHPKAPEMLSEKSTSAPDN